MLRGRATPHADGLCEVALAGGARVFAVGSANGPACVVVRPWDVTIEPRGPFVVSSARNHIAARVTGIAPLGGRVRVALTLPEPLAAEVTAEAAAAMGLRPGIEVTATWKATAARVVPSGWSR